MVMDILKIDLEEQLLIMYYIMKHLILPELQNTKVIKEVFEWLNSSVVYKYFNKKLSATRALSKILDVPNEFACSVDNSEIMSNQYLAKNLHKTNFRKFKIFKLGC